jgi:uncharacterized coiled-coil protein SlyX
MDERLNDLEIRLTYQERTLQELNELVWEQRRFIERLEQELALLREQLKITLPSLVRAPADEEPPPHW